MKPNKRGRGRKGKGKAAKKESLSNSNAAKGDALTGGTSITPVDKSKKPGSSTTGDTAAFDLTSLSFEEIRIGGDSPEQSPPNQQDEAKLIPKERQEFDRANAENLMRSAQRQLTSKVIEAYNLGLRNEKVLRRSLLSYCNIKGFPIILVAKHVSSRHRLEQELDMLRRCEGCKNVVKLHVSDVNIDTRIFVMVEERCESYSAYWARQRKNTEEDEIHIVLSCINMLDGIDALEQLRKVRIIHRDISPNNFMYSLEDYCWKLIDFEYAIEASEGNADGFVVDAPNIYGTDGYIAPEAMNQSRYSYLSDLYSFGKTAYDVVAEPCVRGCMMTGQGLSMEASYMFDACHSMSSSDINGRNLNMDEYRRQLIDLIISCVDISMECWKYLGPEYLLTLQRLLFKKQDVKCEQHI